MSPNRMGVAGVGSKSLAQPTRVLESWEVNGRQDKEGEGWDSLVAQWVKDPALSLGWVGLLMLKRFEPWPGNFHMPWKGKKKKKKKGRRRLQSKDSLHFYCK